MKKYRGNEKVGAFLMGRKDSLISNFTHQHRPYKIPLACPSGGGYFLVIPIGDVELEVFAFGEQTEVFDTAVERIAVDEPEHISGRDWAEVLLPDVFVVVHPLAVDDNALYPSAAAIMLSNVAFRALIGRYMAFLEQGGVPNIRVEAGRMAFLELANVFRAA
jgi:hypothetical protein